MREMSSTWFDVGGPVHVADLGGPPDAPVLLCVHGLASSHAAWRPLATELSSHRVLAVDLPGHGRSAAAGRSTAVKQAGDVLGGVIERLDAGPVTVVGHSMGAAAAVLAAQQTAAAIERLVLLAPPMPRDRLAFVSPALLPHVLLCALPLVGHAALSRRLAQGSVEQHIMDGLRLTCGSLDAVAELAPALVAEFEAARDRGEDPVASFIEAARSVGLLVAGGRWYREAMRAVQAPVDIVQGALDRVLNPAGLDQVQRLQPTWTTHLLEGVGHSPHMEAPAVIAGLLEGLGRTDAVRRSA